MSSCEPVTKRRRWKQKYDSFHGLASQSTSAHSPHLGQTPHTSRRKVPRKGSSPSNDCFEEMPAYVQPLSYSRANLDLEGLETVKALHVPKRHLRDQLVESYFEYANITMPLFDRVEIWKKFGDGPGSPSCDGGEKGISLLLLQAILFVGSAFVSNSAIRMLGFTSRSAARETFYTRARVLYDLDTELDPIILCQVSLLFTHWTEVDEHRGPWHWMGAAVSQLQASDLAGTIKDDSPKTHQTRMLKRLWWSCYIRDTFLALGFRCQSRFPPGEDNIPMLELDDFDLPSEMLSEEPHPQPSLENPRTKSSQTRQAEAALSIEFAKLCICYNRILWAPSTVQILLQSGLWLSHPIVSQNRKSVMALEVRKCTILLQEWSKGISVEAMCNSDAANVKGGNHKSLTLHRILLQMAFSSAWNCLYRPQIVPSDSESGFAPPPESTLCKYYKKRLFMTAAETSSLANAVISSGLEEYLPSFSISFLIPTVMVQQIQLRVCRPSTRARIVRNNSYCMQVLRSLRRRYTCAERAMTYVDVALLEAVQLEAENQAHDDESTISSLSSNRSPHQEPPTAQSNTPALHASSGLLGEHQLAEELALETVPRGNTIASIIPSNPAPQACLLEPESSQLQVDRLPLLDSDAMDVVFQSRPETPQFGELVPEYYISDRDMDLLAVLRDSSVNPAEPTAQANVGDMHLRNEYWGLNSPLSLWPSETDSNFIF